MILQPTVKLCCLCLFLGLVSTLKSKKNHIPWLQKAVTTFVELYTDSAKREGNITTMNTNELEHYLKMNAPETLQDQDPDFVQKTLESLDENRDGELNFMEFWTLQMQFLLAKYDQKYKWKV